MQIGRICKGKGYSFSPSSPSEKEARGKAEGFAVHRYLDLIIDDEEAIAYLGIDDPGKMPLMSRQGLSDALGASIKLFGCHHNASALMDSASSDGAHSLS